MKNLKKEKGNVLVTLLGMAVFAVVVYTVGMWLLFGTVIAVSMATA